jgi:Glycosyltransferase like family 2
LSREYTLQQSPGCLEYAKCRYSKSPIWLKNSLSVVKLRIMGAEGIFLREKSESGLRISSSLLPTTTSVSDEGRVVRGGPEANFSLPSTVEQMFRAGYARVHSEHRASRYDGAAPLTAARTCAPTLLNSSPRRSISSWADIVEAYRPVAMANKRCNRAPRPKVSVCITSGQADRHLQATIDSCFAQHFAALELVIIYNSTSDDTRDILETVKDDRVRVVPSATRGPVADDFNMAVQQSNGQFVKLICAGDVLHPDCIAKQTKLLEDNRDVALVGVRTDHIDDDGNLLSHGCGLAGLIGRHSGERAIRRIARSSVDPVGPAVSGLFRRVDFDRCGGCRRDLLFPMDMGLWLRLLAHGDFIGVPNTLASSRRGSGLMAQLSRRGPHQAPGGGGRR